MAALEIALVAWLSAGRVQYEDLIAWGVSASVNSAAALADLWRPRWTILGALGLLTGLLLLAAPLKIDRLGLDHGAWATMAVPLTYLAAPVMALLAGIFWLVPATMLGLRWPRSGDGWALERPRGR